MKNVLLYEKEIDDMKCKLVELDRKLYTVIGEEKREVDGEIAEQNKCELLFDCLIETAYMLYKTDKELKEISFD